MIINSNEPLGSAKGAEELCWILLGLDRRSGTLVKRSIL